MNKGHPRRSACQELGDCSSWSELRHKIDGGRLGKFDLDWLSQKVAIDRISPVDLVNTTSKLWFGSELL